MKDSPPETSGGLSITYWALVGFTVILLLAPQLRYPVLAPLRIALLSVAVAAVACGYDRLKRKLPLVEFSPDVILLLLLTAWAAVTLPFSYWPGGSVGFLADVYFKAVFCFLLLSHAVTGFRQLRGISWCLVICAAILALSTLSNYLSGNYIEGGGDRVAGYTSGLAGNPNDMALVLNLILPVCIALILGTRSSLKKLVLAGIAVLITLAVIATFSRAGFLTLVFVGASYAWLLRRRRQRVWIPVVMALGLFALPLMPGSYVERLSTIVNVEEDTTQSAQTRLSDMKVATGIALTHPIVGAGIGMSMLAMNEARGDEWLEIHNVYLQLALDLGFPGLLLFLLLLWQCLRVTSEVARPGRHDPDPEPIVLLAEALRVSLLAFALSGMFYPVTYNFYFYYFAGLAIATGRISRQATGEAGE